MSDPYKLKPPIKQFIIEKKRANPKLSCRKLIPLIRQRFQVSLSKSLINSVIKQNNLSSPVGRKGVKKKGIKEEKEKIIARMPVEIRVVRKERAFIEHGGSIFLKLADFKLSLLSGLAESIYGYFQRVSVQDIQGMIEALVFTPLFKGKKSLWENRHMLHRR